MFLVTLESHPSPDLYVCTCVPSGLVGVGRGLSGVSSANHNVPFLPLCCHSIRPLKKSSPLFFSFFPPSATSAGRQTGRRGRRKSWSWSIQNGQEARRRKRRTRSRLGLETCMHLYATPQTKSRPGLKRADVRLVCCAQQVQTESTEGYLYACVHVCVGECVCEGRALWQRYKPSITQWCVAPSHKIWLKTSQAGWSYDVALKSLEGVSHAPQKTLMRFFFLFFLRFENVQIYHVHWW